MYLCKMNLVFRFRNHPSLPSLSRRGRGWFTLIGYAQVHNLINQGSDKKNPKILVQKTLVSLDDEFYSNAVLASFQNPPTPFDKGGTEG